MQLSEGTESAVHTHSSTLWTSLHSVVLGHVRLRHISGINAVVTVLTSLLVSVLPTVVVAPVPTTFVVVVVGPDNEVLIFNPRPAVLVHAVIMAVVIK